MVAAPHEGLGERSALHCAGAPTRGLYPSDTRGVSGGWVDPFGRLLVVPRRNGGWFVHVTIPLPSPALDPWLSDIPPALPTGRRITLPPDASGEQMADVWQQAVSKSAVLQTDALSFGRFEPADAFDLALHIASATATWGLRGDFAERAAAAVLALSTPPMANLLPGAQAAPRVSALDLATGFARLAMQGGVALGPAKARQPVARKLRTALRWIEFGSEVYRAIAVHCAVEDCIAQFGTRDAAEDSAAT